jgi:mono/diheme cytochrome c family protein
LSGRTKKNELRRASFAGLNGGGFQSEGAAAGGFRHTRRHEKSNLELLRSGQQSITGGITMRQIYINILLGVGFLLLIHETSHTASQPGDSMTRGKYIVDHVAMCVECHTPRNDKGEILSGQYLKGAPIPLNPPPYPNIKWAIKAPGIVGLVGYTKQQGIRLLTEGITSDGRIPNPPMPRFRLTRSDAEAVVDYLKSLK